MSYSTYPYGWTDNGKVINITKEAYESILSQAKADAPIESCGYALGVAGEDGTLLITENYRLTNIDHAEEHFSLDPKEQFAAIKYARTNKLKVIGNWHSHPASPVVRQKRIGDLHLIRTFSILFSPLHQQTLVFHTSRTRLSLCSMPSISRMARWRE